MKNVYVKQSLAFGNLTGLFAKKRIEANTLFIKFKGSLRSSPEDVLNDDTSVYFSDGKILDIDINDVGLNAKDLVILNKEHVAFFESFIGSKPFFKKHPKFFINSEIYISDNSYDVYLCSTKVIEENEEIFYHRGFNYWYKKIKLKKEPNYYHTNSQTCNLFDLFTKKFPVFDPPGFELYLDNFYPNCTKTEYLYDKQKSIIFVVLCLPNTKIFLNISLDISSKIDYSY